MKYQTITLSTTVTFFCRERRDLSRSHRNGDFKKIRLLYYGVSVNAGKNATIINCSGVDRLT